MSEGAVNNIIVFLRLVRIRSVVRGTSKSVNFYVGHNSGSLSGYRKTKAVTLFSKLPPIPYLSQFYGQEVTRLKLTKYCHWKFRIN
jgi:hypothetical protein